MKRLYIFVLAMLLIGCSAESSGHSESLVDRLDHETETVEPIDLDVTGLLLEYTTVEVKSDSATPLRTVSHLDEVAKYPCSSCHEMGQVEITEAEIQPHLNITLNHATSEVMSCATCHSPNNLDALHTLNNSPVEFDHSYQVCSQCHNPQFKDWVGGAHGKQLESWVEPRVMETCVGCHNPHDPSWGTRWPAVTGGGIED